MVSNLKEFFLKFIAGSGRVVGKKAQDITWSGMQIKKTQAIIQFWT